MFVSRSHLHPSLSLSLYAGKVDELLSDSSKKHEIKFIVLDFTLVLAIDSSAAETIGMYVTLQYSAVDGVCSSSQMPFSLPAG